MKKDLLKGLSAEQIKRVEACKNSTELLAFAKDEGIELSEEQLEAINGGCSSSGNKCPKCGHDKFETTHVKQSALDIGASTKYKCKKCGHVWYL